MLEGLRVLGECMDGWMDRRIAEPDTWHTHTFSLSLLIFQKRQYTIGKLSSDR